MKVVRREIPLAALSSEPGHDSLHRIGPLDRNQTIPVAIFKYCLEFSSILADNYAHYAIVVPYGPTNSVVAIDIKQYVPDRRPIKCEVGHY